MTQRLKRDDELRTQILVDEEAHALRSGRGGRQPALTGGSKRQHGSDAPELGSENRPGSGQVGKDLLAPWIDLTSSFTSSFRERTYVNNVTPAAKDWYECAWIR